MPTHQHGMSTRCRRHHCRGEGKKRKKRRNRERERKEEKKGEKIRRVPSDNIGFLRSFLPLVCLCVCVCVGLSKK